jgi:hypothetical protein
VARLDLKVETLAEGHAGVQARLEGLIQAAHGHQADPERSEQALRATQAEYVGQGLMVHAPPHQGAGPVDAVRPGGYAGATRPRPR